MWTTGDVDALVAADVGLRDDLRGTIKKGDVNGSAVVVAEQVARPLPTAVRAAIGLRR